MNGKRLTAEFANKVYDILVKEAGAPESMRDNFIYCHNPSDQFLCWEYRFGGLFGFGGKYWSETNKINYYPEDRTKKLDKLEAKVNKLLSEIK
jgi:hypothetical protein